MKRKGFLVILVVTLMALIISSCGGGGPKLVPVTAITVAGEGNEETVLTGETLQMEAQILPLNASNKGVTWTVENAANDSARDCHAEITQEGVLTGLSGGTVVVKATAKDGSEVEGTKEITVDEEIIKWYVDFGGKRVSRASIGENGVIYILVSEYLDTNSFLLLYALDENGNILWVQELSVNSSTRVSAPVIGKEGNIFITANDPSDYNKSYLIALNSDGTEQWKISCDTSSRHPSIGTDGTIYNSIQVSSNPSFSKISATNPNGTEKWSVLSSHGGPAAIVIDSDGTIYNNDYNYLVAYDSNGIKKWEFETEEEEWAHTPAIGSDSTIYFGSNDTNLYALNPDGTLKWKYQTGSWVWNTPVIDKDGNIYIANSDSALYSINSEGTLNWKHTFNEERVYLDNPILTENGRIYLTVPISFNGPSKIIGLDLEGNIIFEFNPGGIILDESIAVGNDGSIYITAYDVSDSQITGSVFYSLNTNNGGLMNSPWPMYKQNKKLSGRNESLD